MDAQAKKVRVALLSIFSNSLLVVFKLIIGGMIGSVAVISEAIHSGIDLLAAAIAFMSIRAAGQPADEHHAFGHGKFESLSGTIEALLIFVAAGWIIFEAIHKLLHPTPVSTVGWGILVMLFSSGINAVVSRKLFKVGKETDSIALTADGMHLLTDVYTSLGVMAGLLLYTVGSRFLPRYDWAWVDPVSALCVALLILHAAYELTKTSIGDLLDKRLPIDEETDITRIVESFRGQILGYHKFRSRKSGPSRFVEAHIMLNPDMSVATSHDLNDSIVSAIRQVYPGTNVMLHLEPCHERCEPKCLENCMKN